MKDSGSATEVDTPARSTNTYRRRKSFLFAAYVRRGSPGRFWGFTRALVSGVYAYIRDKMGRYSKAPLSDTQAQ